ncbi:MAG TPA: DMT family transporter [Jatrophihabitantaceae bacterium]
MSIAVAVPLGVASALVYGTSIVFQHSEASSSAPDQGEEAARRLVSLLRNPRWLLALGGDFIGFLLGIAALSAGSVVMIQPLVVLMLPVALVVGWLNGGPRPRAADYLSSLGIIGGLAVFLILIGRPHTAHVPHSRYVALTVLIVLASGIVICFAATGRSAVVRGAVYGVVAGAFYGTLGVMVDAASDQFSEQGLHGLLATGRGLVPLIGVALLGLGGIVLTQMSFQVGALAATLPASLATDPLAGVLIGALLLREHLPHSVGHLIAYSLCLVAVIAGAVRLAGPATAPHPGHPSRRTEAPHQAEWTG